MVRVITVVLNWNGFSDTRTCVQSLVRHQPSCELQLIVVDNGSSDDSLAKIQAEFPDARTIAAGTNGGFSRGNNIGIEAALNEDADYVFLLNNDVELNPGCIDVTCPSLSYQSLR